MQIGWIDFSKEDRKKVLSVMDLLSGDGALDELGIAPIRDGFADLFFPGTSTIQTRAKYFLIVPYALYTLERQPYLGAETMAKRLDDMERECAERLVSLNADRVIGVNAIKAKGWVKRTPADIYWAGIRRYGIFQNDRMSLAEYIRAYNAIKKRKQDAKKLGNRNDDAGDNGSDDTDAGALYSKPFWYLPSYSENWKDTLKMELTRDEACFLKQQIATTQKNSMFSYILDNNMHNIAAIRNFADFSESRGVLGFPLEHQKDHAMALGFSNFIYGVFLRYNMILLGEKHTEVAGKWEKYTEKLTEHYDIDIDAIFDRLKIARKNSLYTFLNEVKRLMRLEDTPALDKCIKNREKNLKGEARAKAHRAGEFDKWVGMDKLDYRFSNAMTIARDIFRGLEVE